MVCGVFLNDWNENDMRVSTIVQFCDKSTDHRYESMAMDETDPRAVLEETYEKVRKQEEVIYAKLTVRKDTVPRAHQPPFSAVVAPLSRNLSVLAFLSRSSFTCRLVLFVCLSSYLIYPQLLEGNLIQLKESGT